MSAPAHVEIDRARLGRLLERERARFAEQHPRSRELYAETSQTLLGGVPMSWMTMWAGGFPLFMARARGDGVPRARPGNVGPAVDPVETTKVIEFNDVDALRAALEPGDVAAVLAEPALTNIGIVLPEPGYHEQLRRITNETGTLLIIDET